MLSSHGTPTHPSPSSPPAPELLADAVIANLTFLPDSFDEAMARNPDLRAPPAASPGGAVRPPAPPPALGGGGPPHDR
eukprot:364288-Prorocentrum_minimum.AAC.1